MTIHSLSPILQLCAFVHYPFSVGLFHKVTRLGRVVAEACFLEPSS